MTVGTQPAAADRAGGLVMTDWTTRLAVSYTDPDTRQRVDIAPIDCFTPSFSLNADVLHSLAQDHIGVVHAPQSMSFSITVKAVGAAAGRLTALALKGARFDITLQANTGADWFFASVVMSECIITSAAPTPATLSGDPAATFSGFSLGAPAPAPKRAPACIA